MDKKNFRISKALFVTKILYLRGLHRHLIFGKLSDIFVPFWYLKKSYILTRNPFWNLRNKEHQFYHDFGEEKKSS